LELQISGRLRRSQARAFARPARRQYRLGRWLSAKTHRSAPVRFSSRIFFTRPACSGRRPKVSPGLISQGRNRSSCAHCQRAACDMNRCA